MNKKSVFTVLMGVMLAMSVLGCNGKLTIPERFFLAYPQASSSEIRVRYSDGAVWKDGSFPAAVSGTSFRGVGALADKRGVMHVVVTDRPDNSMHLVWGLGPAIWDNSGRAQTTHTISSAPSAVDIGDKRFLIVYRRDNGTVSAILYDHDLRSLGDFSPPAGSANSNVVGRPAITLMNGKLLLAWRTFDNGFHLFTAVGQVQNGFPVFSQPREIPLPLTSDFGAGLDSEPDVTHNHNRFYVAFVRKQLGTGSWRVVVHSSVDGVMWQEHSVIAGLIVDNMTNINIAGRSDGPLIAAAVRRYNGEVSVARFRNSQWSALSDTEVQAMFGANRAAPKQFTLIGTGKP